MATLTTKKAKRHQHKARLSMEEIREAFGNIKTESLHGLLGWLFAAAQGDEFTEGSREIRAELSNWLETSAAYDREYRAKGRPGLCTYNADVSDERINEIAGDYKPMT